MKKIIYYDLSLPEENLIRVVSSGNLELGRIELELNEDDNILEKLKEELNK